MGVVVLLAACAVALLIDYLIAKEFYSECGKYNFRNYYSKNFSRYANIKRGTNTTLAVIVTNIEMTREEANYLIGPIVINKNNFTTDDIMSKMQILPIIAGIILTFLIWFIIL